MNDTSPDLDISTTNNDPLFHRRLSTFSCFREWMKNVGWNSFVAKAVNWRRNNSSFSCMFGYMTWCNFFPDRWIQIRVNDVE